MRKTTLTVRIIAVTLVSLLLLFTASACGSKSGKSSNAAKTAQKGSVPITILTTEDPTADTTWAQVKDSPVVKQIEQKTNTVLTMNGTDANKFQVLKASGDIPSDLLFVTSKIDVENLIKGNQIIPIDDLVNQRGPDIKLTPSRIELSKKYFSAGTGKLYCLPSNTGMEGHEATIYHSWFNLRWDYYKELGYPEIKTIDDMLNVLSQIQKKHPTNSDGKKVYGLSLYQGGAGWLGWGEYASCFGYASSGSITFNMHNPSQLFPTYSENSPYWDSLSYFYKANQLGLLDPDAFTQTYDDYANKITNGQVMSPPANWFIKDFNQSEYAKDPNSLIGIESIPVAGTSVHTNVNMKFGFDGMLLTVTKSSKHPEKVVDLINYLFSYEGSRLAKSGVKGLNWDVVNGVAQYTPATAKLVKSGGQDFIKTGISFFEHFAGFGHGQLDPTDKQPMYLIQGEKYMEDQMLPVDKDFSKHYNGKYPYDVFNNEIKKGTIKDYSDYLLEYSMCLDTAPDDIKAIDTKVSDLADKAMPKLILAKSQNEFNQFKAKLIDDLNKANMQKSIDWWTTSTKKALEEIKKY